MKFEDIFKFPPEFYKFKVYHDINNFLMESTTKNLSQLKLIYGHKLLYDNFMDPAFIFKHKMNNKKKFDLLFFCDSQGYLYRFYNIFEFLKNKKIPFGILTRDDKVRAYCFKNNIPCFSTLYWFICLSKVYQNKIPYDSKYVRNLVESFIRFLKIKNVKYFITGMDAHPLEKFFIYCSKKANVKTICVQDGIFGKFPCHGHFADYMLVWGESQRKLYKGIKDLNNVKILGYIYKIEKFSSRKILKKSICFFGQNFESYSDYLMNMKYKIIKILSNKLYKYKLYYKPHPNEGNLNFLPRNIELFRGSIEEAFRKYDIFISISSTTLVEASLRNKISIQIHDKYYLKQFIKLFDIPNYQKCGYCYSVENLNNLSTFINNVKKPYFVSNKIIYRPNNVGERFYNLLLEIS